MNFSWKGVYDFCHKWGIFDWLIVIIALVAGLLYEYDPFPDDFQEYIISEVSEQLKTSTVSYDLLCIINFGIGGVIVIILWFFHAHDSTTSRALAGYYFSLSFTIFVSTILKKYVARPRPDSIALCGGDGGFQACKKVLDPGQLANQFYSFPSGHAAETMATCTYISLMLSDIWIEPSMISAYIKFSPILFAFLIGASRIWDRAHHVDDVVMGFVLGGIIGFFTYKNFYKGLEEEKRKEKLMNLDTSAAAISMRGYV